MNKAHLLAVSVSAAVLVAPGMARAQVLPPAGFGEDVSKVPETNEGVLALAPEALPGLVQLDPAYRRKAQASVKVLGAYAVTGVPASAIAKVSSPGYLPVLVTLRDGSCQLFNARYGETRIAGGRMRPARCVDLPNRERPVPQPPAEQKLRFIGSSWTFAAWADDAAGTTIITRPPEADRHEPLFTTRMKVESIMAMHGPDWPGGNVTLYGMVDGKPTIMVLDVAY